MKEALTQERLQEVLDYDPATGHFVWKVALSRNSHVGERAGSLGPLGYVVFSIDNNRYRGHQLAWLYVYGTKPKMIDHINCVRHDNRIKNLRQADRKGNSGNARKTSKSTTSRYKGVSFDRSKGRWVAQITRTENGKKGRFKLGQFLSESDAAAAYISAAIAHFGEFARV